MKYMLCLFAVFITFNPVRAIAQSDTCPDYASVAAFSSQRPDASSAQKCGMIPAECHQDDISGGVTYYTRSECYDDLAQATQNPDLCKYVLKREWLFLKAGKFTEDSCRERVAQKISETVSQPLQPEVHLHFIFQPHMN